MSDVQYMPPPPPPPIVPPVVPPGPPLPPQFDFGRPFSFVFDDPRWLQKILIGGLFYLAGFVLIGWFFIFGYVARTTRNLIAGAALPLPEWDDLGDFFSEGVRLFGVVLLYAIPFIIMALVFIVPSLALSSTGEEGLEAAGGVMFACVSCLLVPLSLVVLLFLPASLLFAVAEQRFGAAFELRRIWPFIRENIGNYLLAIVVYLIARFIGGAGTALLCIGVIFTGFWSVLISAHGFAQVYRLSSRR
ncbi:MAG TPA: DUF4013 domain-containing protein [Thermoanaerobaculia bacterium]